MRTGPFIPCLGAAIAPDGGMATRPLLRRLRHDPACGGLPARQP